MREEDLEAALLLTIERGLVRVELPHFLLAERGGERVGYAPERDGNPIVPAPILGRVITWLDSGDRDHPPELDLTLEHREVVLAEERDELRREAPFHLVVVVDDVRFRRALGARGGHGEGRAHQGKEG